MPRTAWKGDSPALEPLLSGGIADLAAAVEMQFGGAQNTDATCVQIPDNACRTAHRGASEPAFRGGRALPSGWGWPTLPGSS
jgi:hypothetical protein